MILYSLEIVYPLNQKHVLADSLLHDKKLSDEARPFRKSGSFMGYTKPLRNPAYWRDALNNLRSTILVSWK